MRHYDPPSEAARVSGPALVVAECTIMPLWQEHFYVISATNDLRRYSSEVKAGRTTEKLKVQTNVSGLRFIAARHNVCYDSLLPARLAQCLADGRKQVLDDPPPPGLDLGL